MHDVYCYIGVGGMDTIGLTYL